jgi:hypothetical protein
MKKYLKNFAQNTVSGFDFSGKCGILCSVGCGNPMSVAEAAAVNGGELLEKSNIVDSIFGSAGCALRNVTTDTITTPAGSFFVPGVVTGGKSQRKIISRRLTPCKANLQNVRNRSHLFNTILSATTPPGVCPNFSMFRSSTPEPIL